MSQDDLSSSAKILSAFLHQDTPSLADVRAWIAADETLPLKRRGNLLSALRKMAEAAGGTPEQLPASLAILRRRTAGFHPEHAGFSPKRWQNIQSEVLFAFRRLGLINPRRPCLVPFLPAWQSLWEAAASQGQLRWHLSRLFHFCSALGIPPEEISDATLAAFHQALVAESWIKDPDAHVRRTVWLWNKARRQVPGWPAVELTVANRRVRYTRPLEAFPAAFQADVTAYLERRSGRNGSLFQKDGPRRPFSPRMLYHRRDQIRRLASALVLSGVPIEAITSLADLVAPERLRLALTFMCARTGRGDDTSENIHGLALAALAIARHHVGVGTAMLEELQEIRRQADPKRDGMTERNDRLLRQFDDPRNRALLLHLPGRLVAEAERRGAPDRPGAVLVQTAVAIELLLMCLLRRKNLVSLDAQQHLRWSGAGRTGVCRLTIPAAEVKNRQKLEFELPPEAATLLKLYLERYQPLLGSEPSSWLFPGRSGRTPKNAIGLSDQIKRVVFSRTGLEVTPHLFRHLGANLYLERHPGSYGVLQRMFGHRSAATTYRAYCGLETKATARRFDAEILALRDASRPVLARRRSRQRRQGRA
jgi:integrase